MARMRSAVRLALVALLALTPAGLSAQDAPAPEDLVGRWEGSLSTPQGSLRLVFEVAEAEAGLTARMFSPDQTPQAIPVESVSVDEGTVTFAVTAIPGGARFEGALNDEGALDGTWFQGPASLPLVLRKAPGEGR